MTHRSAARRRQRTSIAATIPSTRRLLRGQDHGEPISVSGRDIGILGGRWVEPFLAANMAGLRRLDLHYEIRADPTVRLLLKPGSRIGALPLLSPETHKVAAGLLIEPRFRWESLGSVFNTIGFSVEPEIGGAPLVPGSAREVPPWMLAGPVIERIAGLLRHRRRGFVERSETRGSPRGRVDWTTWATKQVPGGSWSTFPCRFSEPDDDPDLMSSIRWTLGRLKENLATVSWSPPAKRLLHRTAELESQVGPGISRRPSVEWLRAGDSEWVVAAMEAMGWISEERGLGGARNLDGLAWMLSIDAVWEAWVTIFAADLARYLGMTVSPFRAARRPIRWHGPADSMRALAPDVELRGNNHVIWVDAKYKAHLDLLTRRGWTAQSQDLQNTHRADLHQALAYAALADTPTVDTMLLYPQLATHSTSPATVATVTSGRRRVRILLAAVPFGYPNPADKEKYLRIFRQLLTA